MAISKHFPFAPHIITCLLVSFLLLLSGCNQPDHAASSVPGSIQAVQEPANRTTQAPVKRVKHSLRRKNWKTGSDAADCTVPDLRRDKSSGNACGYRVPKGTRVAQKCIHYLYGEDYIYPLSLRVYDACLSCTDTENPWHGDEYDVLIGSSTICHGYQ